MSFAEQILAAELRQAGIPFEREFRFSHRRFRADFWLTDTPFLIEIDGGAWTGGRHVRGKGFEADREKDALALSLGYIPVHFSVAQVNSGDAIETIVKALEYWQAEGEEIAIGRGKERDAGSQDGGVRGSKEKHREKRRASAGGGG